MEKDGGGSQQRHPFAQLGTYARRVKTQPPPEHKAYMALAVAIGEAIKAFIALDESLK
ncbi:MAG: hypothetical protein LBU06_03545 [Desulfovibrio sp.]|jgi:hypothetical protein|nr:hypothetical protein [Desulfovibrio sp.]